MLFFDLSDGFLFVILVIKSTSFAGLIRYHRTTQMEKHRHIIIFPQKVVSDMEEIMYMNNLLNSPNLLSSQLHPFTHSLIHWCREEEKSTCWGFLSCLKHQGSCQLPRQYSFVNSIYEVVISHTMLYLCSKATSKLSWSLMEFLYALSAITI